MGAEQSHDASCSIEKEDNNIRKQYFYDKYNWVPSLPGFEFDKDRLIDFMNSDVLGDWRELNHFPMKGLSNEFNLGGTFLMEGGGYMLKELETKHVDHVRHIYDQVNPNILLWAKMALKPANFLKYPPYMKLAKHKDRLRTGSIHFPLGPGEPTNFYDDEYYCKDKLAVVATSTPSSLLSPQKNILREFCLHYFKKFKLVDGFFHIQCIKKDEKIYIIECTRRLPGDYYHEFSTLSLGTSYLRAYINSFIGYGKINNNNRMIKNIVRVVLDDLIISQIKSSEEIKNSIKTNLIKKKKLDGFRIGENNETFRKKESIFLEFDNPKESIDFCKKLLSNL